MMAAKLSNNFSIKKIGTFALCAFIFTLCTLFSACDKTNYVHLNMEYYTLNSSSYELITSASEKDTQSTDFISTTPILRQYDKISLNLSSEWLYLFYASKLSFNITTNYDCQDSASGNTALQFDIIITNIAGGHMDGGYGTKIKTYTIVCEQKANQTKKYSIDVGDYFEKSAETTAIIFKLMGTESYIAHEDFKFAISGVSLYGDHMYR